MSEYGWLRLTTKLLVTQCLSGMGLSHVGYTCEGHSCVIISASNGWFGPGGPPLQAQKVWDLESLWTEQAV